VIYLLDVNALVAFGYAKHVHYPRVIDWLNTLRGNQRTWCLATGAITELGFVRIATGPAGFASSIEQACADLKQLKEDQRVTFLGDALGAEWLPAWVRKSKQTTDGHLVQLACGASDAGHWNPRRAVDSQSPARERSPRAETGLRRGGLSVSAGRRACTRERGAGERCAFPELYRGVFAVCSGTVSAEARAESSSPDAVPFARARTDG
jgi:predicted nucleic acid-binding protein